MCVVGAQSALAVTINVVNNDGPGEGFNDATPVTPVGGNSGTTLGEQRLLAFQYAADLWGSRIDSNVTLT
ncbi:MAG: peptidase, partial [Deltaproteobacteria bacterium]